MKKNIAHAVLLVALSASFIWSQTTSGTPLPQRTPAQIAAARVARLTKLLDLTSAQQATATTIFTTEETTLAGLATNFQTQHSALQTAVLGNDPAAITAAAGQIGTLTTQRVTADANARAAFYAILTPDQQTKYTSLEPVGRGERGRPFGRRH